MVKRGKGLSWFVSDRLGFRNARLPEVDVPQQPTRGLDAVLRTLRRRLDDRVSDVFHTACVSGDLDVAEKLLVILEEMHERRRQAHENERRQISDETVERARHELERCREAQRAALG